jgi:hypothetical protein
MYLRIAAADADAVALYALMHHRCQRTASDTNFFGNRQAALRSPAGIRLVAPEARDRSSVLMCKIADEKCSRRFQKTRPTKNAWFVSLRYS